MNKEIKKAYLAGILDGEGYFGIRKHRKNGNTNPRYQEEIKVSMVERQPIEMLKEIFGGNISMQKGTHRPLFRYEANDKIAFRVCKALFEYLIIKKKNAKILLTMRKHKEETTLKNMGKRAKPSDIKFRENCYIQCKKNNSPHLYEKTNKNNR